MNKKQVLALFGGSILILLGVFSFLFFVGNAAANKLQVTVSEIQVENVGLTSCDVSVLFSLMNPTNQELSVISSSFDIFISDVYVGKSSLSRFVIPKESFVEKKIRVTVLYSDIASAVLQAIKNKNFDLDVRGTAQVEILFGLGSVTVPFSLSARPT